MSLIACISANGYPVLFADSLLSSVDGREDVILPTVGIASLPRVVGENRPHGIAQKIVQISPSLTVAFAGGLTTATTILETLAKIFRETPATVPIVRGILDAKFPSELQQGRVSLIAVVGENGNLTTLAYNCVNMEVPGIGNIWAAGTGTEALATLLPDIAQSTIQIVPIGPRVLATAVAVGSSLLAAEIMTAGTTLAQGFGAGYEYVNFPPPHGEPQRWTDYCCIFWQTEFRGGTLHAVPHQLIRGVLKDGVGGVFSARFFSAQKILVGDHLFLFRSPLTPGAERAAWEAPELNATMQVNLFGNDQNGMRVAAMVVFRESANGHLVTFRVNGEALEIQINANVYEKTLRDLTGMAHADGA